MFKGHPKGLYALALANTGERFGYYTMLAIFVLFLQAKFGFTAAQAGQFYGFFLAGVYFMPLIGGILADKFGYGKMVTLGIVVMFLGYLLMAVPASGSVAMVSLIGALVLICVGTGLFKGNLQVMVGNLYDDPRYSAKRDSAFSIFYMAINIGAMYAPSAATAIANWQLKKNGFFYDANIPSLANEFLKNPDTGGDVASKLETLAGAQGWTGSIADFASSYIDALAGSYHMGFAVACFSLVVPWPLPRFQEDLQTCRRNLQAAGSTGRRPWRKGCRADQRTDQTAYHCPRARIRGRYLLLDVFPSERSYTHLVRT